MKFIPEYTRRLLQVTSEDRLRELHDWVAAQPRAHLSADVSELNTRLELTGKPEYQLRDDLPCLCTGSHEGLVLLSANPGWDAKVSAKLKEHYDQHPDNYWLLASQYFGRLDPELRNRWWYRAFPYVELLEDDGWSRPRGPAAWQAVHESRKFGGWELIPIASSKDGVTSRLDDSPELRALAEASVKAILTLAPALLIVGNKWAADFVRDQVDANWLRHELEGEVRLEHCCKGGTEIVLIHHQFISARRRFTRAEVFDAVKTLRTKH